MKIKDIFINEITREITSVVNVDDIEFFGQEIEEYVVTEQLDKYFLKFFEDYANSARIKTEKVGVWISGFFGSGKSHFAKMLGHLLKNDSIRTTTGVMKDSHDIFKDRLIGCTYESDINRNLFEIWGKISPKRK